MRIKRSYPTLLNHPPLIWAFILLLVLCIPGKAPTCHASRFFEEEKPKKKPRYVAKSLFKKLPDELLCTILSYLPGNNLVFCAAVSKYFKQTPFKVMALYPIDCTIDGRQGFPQINLVHQLHGLHLHHTLKHTASLEKLAEEPGSLKSLTLGPCVADTAKSSLLFKWIKQNPNLHSLDLTLEKLDIQNIKMLASALRTSHSLKTVRFFCSKQSLTSLKNCAETDQILEAVQDGCPDLAKLTVEGIPFESLSLKLFPNLQELAFVFHPNQLGKGLSMPDLPIDAGKAFAFQALTLRHAGLGTQEARSLSKILKHCKDLKHLDLTGNYLGDQALDEIIRALPKTLITLILNDMAPEEMTASALQSRLPVFQNLLRLSVDSSDDFDPDPVLQAASVHPTLQTVSLKGSQNWTEKAFESLQILMRKPPDRMEQVMFSWKSLMPDQQSTLLKTLDESRMPRITLPANLPFAPTWKGSVKTGWILSFLERNTHVRTLVLEGAFNAKQIQALKAGLDQKDRKISVLYPDIKTPH